MNERFLFAAATLAVWLGFLLIAAAVYQFAAARAALQPERGERSQAAITDLVSACIFLLASLAIPHEHAASLALPLFWPIMPFSGWAALVSAVLAIGYGIKNLALERSSFWAPLVWLLSAFVFGFIFDRMHETMQIATGHLPLSFAALATIVVLAFLATVGMAGTSRKLTASGYAKAAVTHITLLIGCVVFGLPFFWLVITSVKEDRDMASPAGIVWIPKVQQTISAWDTIPPIFVTTFQGRGVKVEIMSKASDGTSRVNVVSPAGIQGVAFDTSVGRLRQVPVDAPIESGPYNNQRVTAYVIQEFGDGRQTLKALAPQALKGTVFTALSKDFEPVRKIGAKWSNYTEALGYLPPEANNGLTYLKNTLLIVILSVIGTLISSSLVAYSFSRLRFPGRDLLFGVLLSTMMLPSAVTLLPRFIIFRDLGWIDTLLPLWVPAFFASAFNVFLLRQFFKNIPTELEDAAKIDGCNYLQSYWSVMMPQVKPALAVIGIWTFMGAWNDFMGPLIYINSPEKMPITYAAQMFAVDRATEPGLIMAFATMSMIPVLLLFFFAQKYFVEGVTLSGFGGK